MQVDTVKEAPRAAARAAGLAYLISFALVAAVEFGVHQRVVSGDPILQTVDAAATARNIAENLWWFRLGIAIDLLYCVGVTVVLAAFYIILRPFGTTVAAVAATSRILFAGAWALLSADLFGTTRLLSGASYLGAFSDEQVQAMAALPLSIRWDHYYAGLLFWGISTALFCTLWLRSRYIPRAFTAVGAWATLCAFAYIVDPAFADVVNVWWFDTPLAIFETALSIVLLVKPPSTHA